jgi:tail protein P2 I
MGARLQERTSQLQPPEVDAKFDYALGYLCEGMMHGLEQFAYIVDPPEPAVPWQPLFDVNLCPDWALPWLAQAVGVSLPQSVTADQARQMIVGLSLQKRGTVAAIKAAGDTFLLLGDQTPVYFRERDGGDAYRLEIVAAEDNLPETDRDLTNHIKNPRPNGGAGWSAAWDPSMPFGTGTINPITFGVWDPPDAPPSRHSADILGHSELDGSRMTVRVENNPIAPFNPLPNISRYMAGSLYVRPIKGIKSLKLGQVFRRADGQIITSGATVTIPTTTAWHKADINRKLAGPPNYPDDTTSYGLQLQVEFFANQDFELSVSSAIATERNILEKVTYGDPISNPGLWVWNGAQDNSESHRIPTKIVENAYRSQIPAGIVLSFRPIFAWDYQAMTAQGGTYAQQTTQYLTYRKLSENKKG